jgi:hypothetical protein
LQEALEPYYIYQIGGEKAEDEDVAQSVIGNSNETFNKIYDQERG